MDVILTHENADFDAIASLLGAHKLFPEAVPVLPRRINRNCQAFLALYGAELGLVRPEDLPRQRIQSALLVDTQSLATLKGMKSNLQVQVIDHHERDPDLAQDWKFSGETLGATTTLLVEDISQRSIPISQVEATLLLMGIYEDTGNLAYLSTSPRDVRAAAWLMEKGGDLSMMHEFLHYSLTQKQRELYERLIEAVATHQIGGHSIAISSIRAAGYDEEISTLAHKLRDLLDPPALFVLVELEGYVQLVARSSTEDIDVSIIAAHFGGGGHTRAAAAMIRDKSLDTVEQELLSALNAAVRPIVTVGQIMSHGVQVLTPDTPVSEADDQMRRTGHEGYPVIEAGQIIGLLTRRAVDRSIQFGMKDSPIRQVMEPGSFSVTPHDSVEKLRRLMIETGWGQMPVVHQDKVTGVVTRTDLITLRGATPTRPRQDEIAALMEKALPASTIALVKHIADAAQGMGHSLYFVGGLVRDLLLGAPIVDIDLVVEGDAIKLAQHLADELGGRTVTHGRFGTAKWLLDEEVWQKITSTPPPAPGGESVDFATARTEFYTHPSALPEVERSAIKQDLHRRDFTINTLAIRLDPPHWGELLDFYGGEADLEDKVIRVLHSFSFIDDPTRILRAARLETRLGFQLDELSEGLIANALPLLDRISGDRIRHELEQILGEREPEHALCRLDSLGVLHRIQPGLECDKWVMSRYQAVREELDPNQWGLDPIDPSFVYLALLVYRLQSGQLQGVMDKLKIHRADADDIVLLPELRQTLKQVGSARRPSRIYELLQPYSPRTLTVAWVASERASLRTKLLDYQLKYRHVETVLTGEDLKALGLKPGPLFGRLLGTLRDARLDDRISTREEELVLLMRLLDSDNSTNEV